jgi:hypothetical protein
VLGLAFDICRQAEARQLRPMQFGVADVRKNFVIP